MQFERENNNFNIHTLAIPLAIPNKFFASQLSKLDVPYITYFPLNLSKPRPRSQSSPAIQSRTRSTPSGAILKKKIITNHRFKSIIKFSYYFFISSV